MTAPGFFRAQPTLSRDRSDLSTVDRRDICVVGDVGDVVTAKNIENGPEPAASGHTSDKTSGQRKLSSLKKMVTLIRIPSFELIGDFLVDFSQIVAIIVAQAKLLMGSISRDEV